MKISLLSLAFFFLLLSAGAQTILLPDTLTSDSLKKNRLLPGPVFNYSPETNFVFGISILYTFYHDRKDRHIRPSFVFPTLIYTLNKQLISDLYLNMWSRRNNYHIVFDLSYFKYNYYFFGIGNETKFSDKIELHQKKAEISAIIEKRIVSGFYGGLEFSFKEDRYLPVSSAVFNESLVGYKGGNVTRAGFSIIYDSRNNYTYATKGHYWKLNYSYTFPFLSNNFKFDRIIFESRSFYTFRSKHTIGFNINIESVMGNAPFFELRQLGSPFIMRGYYAGRFREQNFVAGQMEYRFHFTDKWALAGFAGSGSVFKNREFTLPDLKPNYGFGIRYFYDLVSGITIRLDYGWGEKNPGESRIGNFYIFVGEAF